MLQFAQDRPEARLGLSGLGSNRREGRFGRREALGLLRGEFAELLAAGFHVAQYVGLLGHDCLLDRCELAQSFFAATKRCGLCVREGGELGGRHGERALLLLREGLDGLGALLLRQGQSK
jgi:hypothetical protein